MRQRIRLRFPAGQTIAFLQWDDWIVAALQYESAYLKSCFSDCGTIAVSATACGTTVVHVKEALPQQIFLRFLRGTSVRVRA
jgi:hypothetical protein